MNKLPLLSIIIPVYNVEKYLCKCLDSILNQSFADYEVILVDDGSPDKSGDICDTYALRDTRVKVIHKKNGGVSAARNSGLDIACGKWVCFIDSDDYIPAGALKHMTDTAENNDSDMCIFDHRMVEEDGTEGEHHAFPDERSYDNNEIISYILTYQIPVSPYARLFRRELISDMRFENELFIGEDLYFNLDYINKLKTKIFVSGSNVYNYLNRPGSAMNRDSYFDGLLTLNRYIGDFIKDKGYNDTLRFEVSCFYFTNAVSAIKRRPVFCLKYNKEIEGIFSSTGDDVLITRENRVRQIVKVYGVSNVGCYLFLNILNTLSQIRSKLNKVLIK